MNASSGSRSGKSEEIKIKGSALSSGASVFELSDQSFLSPWHHDVVVADMKSVYLSPFGNTIFIK